MKRFAAVVSASLVATGLAATPALAAQEQPAQGAQSQQQSQNFSDDQLQNFASASQEIAGISQDYTKQLQGAGDADAQQSIREEANQKMVQAVQDNDLQVEQFNQIGQAVQNDPQMMQKVQQMAQKKQ
ncbi:DUF4168 domain-containing protein [Kushneria phyllosphaerae]|uniref:DUF4168 domain-containing protein n=1 Tax=Kushneria phyllosphaerae TaxID=2100822 RepID=A0A2R8CL15_9GAMM|nr:DUF4168 domain-containing protein [Kushneria phyllosphaerae]SPJ33607.1 hypothetical protein KSP9073_01617 [Kushneria phyllosphaerae]